MGNDKKRQLLEAWAEVKQAQDLLRRPREALDMGDRLLRDAFDTSGIEGAGPDAFGTSGIEGAGPDAFGTSEIEGAGQPSEDRPAGAEATVRSDTTAVEATDGGLSRQVGDAFVGDHVASTLCGSGIVALPNENDGNFNPASERKRAGGGRLRCVVLPFWFVPGCSYQGLALPSNFGR
jgi:hypothetical protein